MARKNLGVYVQLKLVAGFAIIYPYSYFQIKWQTFQLLSGYILFVQKKLTSLFNSNLQSNILESTLRILLNCEFRIVLVTWRAYGPCRYWYGTAGLQ